MHEIYMKIASSKFLPIF